MRKGILMIKKSILAVSVMTLTLLFFGCGKSVTIGPIEPGAAIQTSPFQPPTSWTESPCAGGPMAVQQFVQTEVHYLQLVMNPAFTQVLRVTIDKSNVPFRFDVAHDTVILDEKSSGETGSIIEVTGCLAPPEKSGKAD